MGGLIAAGEGLLSAARAWLVPVSGPAIAALALIEQPGGSALGRADTADLRLPIGADKVSRNHCRFIFRRGLWFIADSSKWGTSVNGVRIETGHEVPLREGDEVRVTPWTFLFTLSEPTGRRRNQFIDEGMADDTAGEISAVGAAGSAALGGETVELLLQAAELLYAAGSERELAETLADLAVRGTGLPNAAVLKVVDVAGRVEPLAIRRWRGAAGGAEEVGASGAGETSETAAGGEPLYSRSLVERARSGQVAELRTDARAGTGPTGTLPGELGESVMSMKIAVAICAPLTIGDGSQAADEKNVTALLYLDARQVGGMPAASAAPWAASFVMLLARIASLALSNLLRLDMSRRMEIARRELAFAAEAQRTVLPVRSGSAGRWRYLGEARPGQSVGGDFFDVIALPDGWLVVALGDVAGKGISASVLMAATFGYLHALLTTTRDIADAANRVNAFLATRCSSSRFVTLWLGIFDPSRGELCYVDCGHGHAGLQHPGGRFERLDRSGGPPCGIDTGSAYSCERVALPPGGRVVVVSDGLVEQFGPVVDPASGVTGQDQFGMSRLAAALQQPVETPAPSRMASATAAYGLHSDALSRLFDAVTRFAGTSRLSDDATAVLVEWD